MVDIGNKVYEDVLESSSPIIALHTKDVEAALVQFRLLCRQTGKSIYHWSDRQGLISLKATDISVPGCRKLADALRYIDQSMHYGIYVLTHFERHLRGASLDNLLSIASTNNSEQRRVVLLGMDFALPGLLSESVLSLFETDIKATKLRLRDGRWVV